MTTDTSDTNPPRPKVAVIGTGTMGAAMARRLLTYGMDVAVWSRHRESTMPLTDLGASAHEKASDAATDVDVVITMLPTGEATADVMLGQLALRDMRSEATWVQMATIGLEQTERLATQVRTQRPDVTFVDAPVSGSREPAENGQLLILASGPQSAAPALEPVFGALGRATLWLGPAGAGSRMKLVLNTWLAFQTEGAAESAALAEHLGIPATALSEALHDNPLASPYALSKLARMADQDYHADFALDWALKDLDLVAAAVGEGVAPIAADIAERWRDLVQNGSLGLDVSAARLGLGPAEPVQPSRRLHDGHTAADRDSGFRP